MYEIPEDAIPDFLDYEGTNKRSKKRDKRYSSKHLSMTQIFSKSSLSGNKISL